MADADLARRFAQDHTVRSDLARRIFVYLIDEWRLRAVAPISMSEYAREFGTDPTNIARAFARLIDTGWLIEVPRRAGLRAFRVGPGPIEEGSRPRDQSRAAGL
jgi:DNA-binding GntR family transcriptional regulator